MQLAGQNLHNDMRNAICVRTQTSKVPVYFLFYAPEHGHMLYILSNINLKFSNHFDLIKLRSCLERFVALLKTNGEENMISDGHQILQSKPK